MCDNYLQLTVELPDFLEEVLDRLPQVDIRREVRVRQLGTGHGGRPLAPGEPGLYLAPLVRIPVGSYARILHYLDRDRADVGVGNFAVLCLEDFLEPSNFSLVRRQRRLELSRVRSSCVDQRRAGLIFLQ